MSRVGARLAGSESPYPYGASRGASLAERVADDVARALRSLHTESTPGSLPRHGARRRDSAPSSYTLAIAAQLSRAASSQLAWVRARTSSSRVAAMRRRSVAERRLVAAFVLSLVLVASVLADARPLAPLGAAGDAGVGAAARIAGLQALPDELTGSALTAAERPDSVDAGVGYDPAAINEVTQTSGGEGAPYLPDGTLLKPVAIDGSLPNLLRSDVTHYVVQSGDTLTGIATRFHVSMSTLWWANKLTSKDRLKVGSTILIPPVTGILWTVKEGDTLASIAAATKGNVGVIQEFNGLTSDTLIIGQQLMVPNGRGVAIPTPKPAAPVTRPAGAASGPCYSCKFSGTLSWPVTGGYISQYYSSYHPAIDIAAPYGTAVKAAAYGRVLWVGWRSNCGGYQIWVDNGGGLGTAYYHLSAILVAAGTYVSRGQQIGRIGATGCATGPHLHFEVWLGPVQNGGTRVNPLPYL